MRHGYAVVYQDCRGRYRSDGRFTKYLSEAEDGFDTLAWLVRQPWCNGRIGTFGLSYAAHTQAALGCLDPPGLAAQFLDCGGFSNAYRSGIRHGGAFDLKQATWAYNNALADAKDPAVKAALRRRTSRRGSRVCRGVRAIRRSVPRPNTRTTCSSNGRTASSTISGSSRGSMRKAITTDTPMCRSCISRAGTTPMRAPRWRIIVGLSKRGRAPSRLILGPWTHGDRSLSYAGDVDFGPAAPVDGNLAEDFFALRRAWFDRWVKGVANGVEAEPRGARLCDGRRIGAAQRRGPARSWRVLAQCRRLAVAADPMDPVLPARRPQPRPGEAGSAAPPLAFRFDPRDPVPTIGGALSSGEPVMRGGAYDQREGPHVFGARAPYRPLCERPDVLSFATPPLERDIEVTGPVTVRLWIASDGPDTDFTAKLIDVYPPSADYPDGFAMNLTEGCCACATATAGSGRH